MAGTKEIRTKIKSIRSTQKITRAMEMVAASKMRKAQDRSRASRPYVEKIQQVIGHLANANPEYRHPYLVTREVKKIGLIVVATDKGLCGGLNINLFRQATQQLKNWSSLGKHIDLCLVGSKAVNFFGRLGLPIAAQRTHLGDTPALTDLIGSVKVMLERFDAGELDELYVAYNQFINTMSQKPQVEKLLPATPSADAKLSHGWDYIYEPNAKTLLDTLLVRYVESVVYQSVVENVACEQAARMVAMKSATDNAGDIIDELQLIYNKERQAAITQEISEIVGGAAAV